VEGWETQVLEGAALSLTRGDAPVLQVEFTDDNCVLAGTTCQSVYRLIESFGYRMYRFDLKLNALVADSIRSEYGYLNLFAIKGIKAVRERVPILEKPTLKEKT
jgi:hypothetical protein